MSIISIIVTILFIVLFRYIGSLGNGGVGITFLLCMLFGWLGWIAGGFAIKKGWLEAIRFINWSNVITWLIPIVGVFTSLLSFRAYFDLPNLGNHSKGKKLYLTLGLISIILSIINGIAGVLIKLYR